MTKCILVTGIGGNVAQGILRNLLAASHKLRIIGTNTDAVSPGNHLCDRVYQTPFATDPGFIDTISEICRIESVDLIIPSTDYEMYYLTAAGTTDLPLTAGSSAEFNRICMDKYLTYVELSKHGIPFAPSVLPSNYKTPFISAVVKPREGRGSRNVFFNPENPSSFTDDYIIQPLLIGKEITASFYVTRDNDVTGWIVLERQLASGTTIQCEVTLDYESEMSKMIVALTRSFMIRGSCNIQAIVSPDGIVPFEINARISGTNSIRSQFGFKDVTYTLEEYAYDIKPAKPLIKKGSAIRILMDVIYPGQSLSEIKNSSNTHYLF